MNLLSIYTGYALDLIVGDPYSFPHPVRFIGKLISFVEKQIRKMTSSDEGLKIAGFFLCEEECAYYMRKLKNDKVIDEWEGGYSKGNTLATYLHTHFYNNLDCIANFIERGRE